MRQSSKYGQHNRPTWSHAIHDLLTSNTEGGNDSDEYTPPEISTEIDLVQVVKELIILVQRAGMFDPDYLEATHFYRPANQIIDNDPRVTVGDLNHIINLVGVEMFVTAVKVTICNHAVSLNDTAVMHINKFKRNISSLKETTDLIKESVAVE
jgi:hypothetical protein|tara:strand:- start:2073 stop:2531 length:459 start_codon:yes stop_codon:yes gene_type:complete